MSIGRYTRLDEIGRGSFATVYQGVHTVSCVLAFDDWGLDADLFSSHRDQKPM